MAGLWFSSGIDKGFENDLRRMDASLNTFSRNVEKQGTAMNQTFNRIGTGIAAYFGTQTLLNFGQAIIETRGEFQQLEIAFTTMLGGKAKAEKLMAQVTEFAAKTPYELADVGKGAKQLLAFQTPANEVIGTLRKLGDLAAGAGAPLNDLVSIYGKVKAKGKLQAEEMNLFLERGIPLVSELAKKYKTSEKNIYDMASEGQIGFNDLDGVINKLTSDGGMFFNLMEEQSKSMTGQVSNMKDAWSQLLNELGKGGEGIIGGTISFFTSELNGLTESIKKTGSEGKTFADKLRGWAGILSKANPALALISRNIDSLVKGFMRLNPQIANSIQKLKELTSGPAIDKLKQGVLSFLDQQKQKNADALDKLKQTQAANEKAALDQKERAKELAKEQEKEFKKEIKAYEEKLNEQKQLYSDFNSAMEGLTGQRLDNVKNEYASLTKDGATYIDFIKNKLAEETNLKKRSILTKELTEATLNQFAEKQKNEQEQFEQSKKNTQLLLDTYKTYSDKRKDIEKKFNKEIITLQSKGYDEQALVAEKEKLKQLAALDETILANDDKFKAWVESSLPNIAKKGLSAIQDELDKLTLVLDDPNLNIEDAIRYKAEIGELTKLFNEKLKTETESKSSWKDTLEILNGVNSLSKDLIDSFEGIDEKTKDILTTITSVAGNTLNLVTALKAVGAAVSAVDKASAIFAAVSAGIQIINTITGSIKKNEERREQALVSELNHVHSINMALIEQNKLYAEGNSFLSDDKWGTALAGLKAYNSALDYQNKVLQEISSQNLDANQNAPYISDEQRQKINISKNAQNYASELEKALGAISVRTRDRSGIANFFGADDEYKSLLAIYPDVLNASGKLDESILQQIIDTADLGEADKTRLTNLLEVTKAAEEEYNQFGDYISSIFGNIGDEITNSFLLMYQGGTDAMEALQDSFGKMIESFTNDAIEFAYLQPYLNQLNDKTKALGEQYARGEISAQALQENVINTLGQFYNSLQALSPDILAAYRAADELAASAGFDSAFNPDNVTVTVPDSTDAIVNAIDSSVKTSTPGIVQDSITEQTGSEMVGRLNAMMLSLMNIANISADHLDYAVQNLVYLKQIKLNTDYLPEIAANTKKTVEKLETI